MSETGSSKFKSKPSDGQVNVFESPRSSMAEGELSLDDLFDETKTARQNKSLLVSYELDRMGMGKYQVSDDMSKVSTSLRLLICYLFSLSPLSLLLTFMSGVSSFSVDWATSSISCGLKHTV